MAEQKNILIVEDESIVAMEISGYVRELGFNVQAIVSSGVKALEEVVSNKIDLILMDVKLKGDMDGISCAKVIKTSQDIPIIYISAFSDDETLQRAIETNPSSYLMKPFNRKELKVAISIATKNRTSTFKVGDIIFDDEFSFSSTDSELIFHGEIVHLTKKEKHLLALLINSRNCVVSIYEIENELWPEKYSNESTRRALVSRLRAKLNYKFVETIHAIGYRINI